MIPEPNSLRYHNDFVEETFDNMGYHTSGLERLPYEIHLKILRYATGSIYNPEPKFEKKWSVVCRQWRDIIQQQIFENVTVHVGLLSVRTVDHVKRSLELFRTRPVLGQYIQILKLRFDDNLSISHDDEKQTILECIATFFEIVAIVVKDGGGCPEVRVIGGFVDNPYTGVEYDWGSTEPAMYELDVSQSLQSWSTMDRIKTLKFCSNLADQWVLPPETILSLLEKFPDVDNMSWSFMFLFMGWKTGHYFYPKVLEVIKLIPDTITTLELDLRTRQLESMDQKEFMAYESAPYRGGTGDRLCRFIRERSYNLKKLIYRGPVSLELFEDQRLRPEYQLYYDAEEDNEMSKVLAAIKEPYWPNMEYYVVEFENYDSFGNPYFVPISESRYGLYTHEISMISHSQSVYKRTSELEAGCIAKLNLIFLGASVAMTHMPKIQYFEISSNSQGHTKMVFQQNKAVQGDPEEKTDDRMLVKPKRLSAKYILYFRHSFRASPQIHAVWRKKFGNDLAMSDGLNYDY
ncbi:hypothetical protein V1508DRAFT_263952 [Lipomyces doorenjongii]|uniref:uncharacterized protein n=1 Tax=Lipomyces doorenjongii TaxID=383834 RepID=UPI0034CDF68C